MRRYLKVELTPSECRSFMLERLKEIVVTSLEDEVADGVDDDIKGAFADQIAWANSAESFTEILEIMRVSEWDIETAFQEVLRAMGEEQDQLNESWKVLMGVWGNT